MKNNKIIEDLNKEISKYKDIIENLKCDIKMIENGENGLSFWNGSNACKVFKNLNDQVEKNEKLLQELTQCLYMLKK